MRRFTTCLAGVVATVWIGMAATPAVALPPAPLNGAEWWFNAWDIYSVWGHSKGAGMTVAVVESGVNASVPELAGAVRPGIDLQTGGDGRHDYSADGHGTAMAALIAANGKGTGMTGIAPDAEILPVDIGHDVASSDGNDIARGIRWATDHGANVISLSIGAPLACPGTVQDAVRYAVDHGRVVVAAAGNLGSSANDLSSPADCAGVLAVGAVDKSAQPWVDSERQAYVDVAAPGVDIRAIDQNGEPTEGSGTSQATALASGAVALVWSRYPTLSNRQVVARLLYKLRDRPPNGTKDPQRGYGTLLPQEAITATVPADAPNPIFDELAATPTSPPGNGIPTVVERPASRGGGIPVLALVGIGVGAVLVVLLVVWWGRRRRPVAVASQPPASYPTQQPYPPPPYPPNPYQQPPYPPPHQATPPPAPPGRSPTSPPTSPPASPPTYPPGA